MRNALSWTAMALVLAGCGEHAGRTDRDGPRGPNVLIYLVDTLRRDHVGVYGYFRDTTPRLDAFARDAVVFDDARTPSSWTKPAVASLLTGQYPIRHGAVTRANRLDRRATLLGTWLQEAGYDTAAFMSNPNCAGVWGFDQGFAHFEELDLHEFVRADRVTDALFAHLGDSPRTPFCYYAHTVDPHAPYDAPPPYDVKWMWPPTSRSVLMPRDIERASRAQLTDMIAAYDGEIAYNDHEFGRILDRLKSMGLYDDTLIIFTSDHGEEFKEHGFAGHGCTLYEEQVRVPLVIKFPHNAHAGTVVRERVSLLDLVPTVLSAAEIAPPDDLLGRDLAERLPGGARPAPPLFLDLDLRNHGQTRTIQGILREPYKLLRVRSPGNESLLFDLQADPGEQQNLFADKPLLAQELTRLLDVHTSRGAGGVHLWLVNDAGDRQRVVEGTLRTGGRFEMLRTAQLEASDGAALTEGKSVLTFRCVLRNRTLPPGWIPRLLVDDDRVSFRVEPRDAEVTIERLLVDGQPGALFLGPDQRRASVPTRVSQEMAELVVADMDLFFERGVDASIDAEVGAYVGVVPPPRREDVEIDPELRRRLESLGYLD